MARPSSISTTIAPALVVGAVAAGIGPLIWFMVGHGGLGELNFDKSLLGILWFTVKQALLSTLLSLALGMLAARAIARRQFWGRQFLLNLFAVPQALPAIVAVLAMLKIYGNTGLLAGYISAYGLSGIVLVHVFFNLPLATRYCLDVLENIQPESFRLAQQLSFSDTAIFKYIEWPALQNALPRIGGLIFLLCAASFVVVLTLGGPGATTLEVAIYQSLRMDFDVGHAISLSLVQIVLSFCLVFLAGHMVLHVAASGQARLHHFRKDGAGLAAQLMDSCAIIIAALIVLPPLAAILINGILYVSISTATLSATGFSLAIGFTSAVISLGLGWSLARDTKDFQRIVSVAGLIVPPAVLATGWFLALRNFNSSLALTIFLVIALNSLMALPFVVAILAEGFSNLGAQHEKLCAQLGLAGWNKFWRTDLPVMKPAVLQALLLGFVLSLGDLTAVTLLGSQGLVTLPALIHQQMGQYRGHEAGGTALVLTLLCLGFAILAQRIRFRHDQN